jgi:5'-3' exonuclease
MSQEYDNFDSIFVYSDDMDLSVCVNEKTTLRPARTNGKTINMSNYSSTVKPGQFIAYNTIMLYKILHGDRSDNIPALPEPLRGLAARLLYQDTTYHLWGKREIAEYFVKTLCPEVYPQFELVFPYIVEDVPRIPRSKMDADSAAAWGRAVHNGKFRTSKKNIEEEINQLFENSMYMD